MTEFNSGLPKLILASTSIYRQLLVQKMGLTFEFAQPKIDEEKLKEQLLIMKKSAIEIAESLSKAKTHSVFKIGTIVVGGDQLVSLKNEIIGKPETKTMAIEQLKKMNGQQHELITAVTIMTDQKILHINHITRLQMKKLTTTEIENYIELDLPLDCSGSYKIEQHGICLFSKIETDDFTAIQGLPMIWLSTQLKGLGYELFKK
jgi:septum formation protein